MGTHTPSWTTHGSAVEESPWFADWPGMLTRTHLQTPHVPEDSQENLYFHSISFFFMLAGRFNYIQRGFWVHEAKSFHDIVMVALLEKCGQQHIAPQALISGYISKMPLWKAQGHFIGCSAHSRVYALWVALTLGNAKMSWTVQYDAFPVFISC